MKKFLLILLIFIMLSSVYLVKYNSRFNISDNPNQIQEHIKSFINRPTKTFDTLEISQTLNIDNKKFILFLADGKMGSAEMIKGLNHKLNLYLVEYGGSGFFRGYIYKTNKANYIVIYGKNKDKKISYLTVSIDNEVYKIAVPKEDYFLVYHKVQDDVCTLFPAIDAYKFYDIDNNEL